MSDENNATPSAEPAAVPSLNDVISDFNPPTPPQMPAAQPQAAEPAVPQFNLDPENPEAIKSFASQTASTTAELQGQVQQLNSQLSEIQQERVNAQVTADINSAVDKVSEASGIDNKKYVEFRLSQYAMENQNFNSLWENRSQFPDKYNQALDAIAHEIKNEMEFKNDPQIAENYRAAQESTANTASVATKEYNNHIEEELANAKTLQERDMIRRKYMMGG